MANDQHEQLAEKRRSICKSERNMIINLWLTPKIHFATHWPQLMNVLTLVPVAGMRLEILQFRSSSEFSDAF